MNRAIPFFVIASLLAITASQAATAQTQAESTAKSTIETTIIQLDSKPADSKPADNKPADSKSTNSQPPEKLLLKPGQPLTAGMQTEDIVVTDNVQLAKEQVAAYPDSPEASFVLAVALTRTSMVEQALSEVRRARKLADKKGGPTYFDKMITEYEEMLKSYPNDNRVRYGLAWAYYMKAYVLAQYSKKAQAAPSTTLPASPTLPGSPASPWQNNWVSTLAANAVKQQVDLHSNTALTAPHIKGALETATPDAVPHIKYFYEAALKNLDELLSREPDDIWARVYRAFLNAEYTGDLTSAMRVWQECQAKSPDNPAPYFFLGEGYLKEGNLKECLQNISKAVALRGLGK